MGGHPDGRGAADAPHRGVVGDGGLSVYVPSI